MDKMGVMAHLNQRALEVIREKMRRYDVFLNSNVEDLQTKTGGASLGGRLVSGGGGGGGGLDGFDPTRQQ